MSVVNLRVSVPVCGFKKSYAREFLESERVPPPATVYGFLLAMVGEEDRREYIGTRLALGITRTPEVSTILRTSWRIKNKKMPLGTGNNKRPDYQEILTGLEIAVFVDEGELADRLRRCRDWGSISRYGGLSLGESRDLVDEVALFPNWDQQEADWLVADNTGDLPLPIWVDHIGSKGTNWGQFRLAKMPLETPDREDPRWVSILPPP
ncbi:MAG: type I-MYXAN CRISPR-associated protein Cas5/Cmx5/DevS [Candidatus Coatesbacteria bacterium]|nr:MAG: type I-MYXAN CRISPR-associated protein Cas5/Cmx5/DevS [Candidatus Coatesbacteria bacterium]